MGDLASSSFTKTPVSATSTFFSLSSAASNLKYLRVARNTNMHKLYAQTVGDCTSCWGSFVNFVVNVLPSFWRDWDGEWSYLLWTSMNYWLKPGPIRWHRNLSGSLKICPSYAKLLKATHRIFQVSIGCHACFPEPLSLKAPETMDLE